MEITIDQATALCAVVDHGGYTKAAEKLHKSHTSLIYLIKNLEAQCGFPIFNRDRYKNSLTTPGHSVYIKCHELLNKLEELKTLCHQFSNNWESSIKIVFDGILPISPFLNIYKKFKLDQIPTNVQTYIDYLNDVETSFHNLNADIMISVVPINDKKLKRTFLKPIKMFLVAHKDHAIHQTNKKWSLNDLQSFYFLTVRSVQQNLGLNTSEFEQSASFYLSDFSFKKEAILKKVGFGWLPEHIIEMELKNKTLIPIKWERKNSSEIQPILYTKTESNLGHAAQLIIEALTS